MTRRDVGLALATLLVASAVVFALPLGRRPLDNQDEARYSLLAREAVEHGHWILPRVRDEVYLNKPPLFFWTVAALRPALRRVVTDATAPIASVVSALVGLLAVFAIGRLLWGAAAGLAAALVLATSPFYFFMAHQVLTDMMLTAWMSWALYFYLAARSRSPHPLAPAPRILPLRGGRSGEQGSGGPHGGGGRDRGDLSSSKGSERLKRLQLPLGLGLIVLTALPWLLPYLLQRERSYGRAVVMTDYLGWYFENRRHLSPRGGGQASRELPAVGLLLLPGGVVVDSRARCGSDAGSFVWAATLIVLLSLSGEQRARYYLPALARLRRSSSRTSSSRAAERARRLVDGGGCRLPHADDRDWSAFVIWGTASGPDAVFLPAASWERWIVAGALVAGAALALLSLRVDQSGLVASAWIAVGSRHRAGGDGA